jgi:hypothetical protein
MSECGIVVYSGKSPTGNTPCFNLGTGSGLFVNDFRTDGSRGSWLLGAGNNSVNMTNVGIAIVGGVNDGNDYFVVAFSAATNNLVVRNSSLGGLPSSAHVHGINIGTNTMGRTIVQNSIFNYLNDSITGTTNNRVVLTGNTSFSTNRSGVSVNLTGSGKMVYGDNYCELPPSITTENFKLRLRRSTQPEVTSSRPECGPVTRNFDGAGN